MKKSRILVFYFILETIIIILQMVFVKHYETTLDLTLIHIHCVLASDMFKMIQYGLNSYQVATKTHDVRLFCVYDVFPWEHRAQRTNVADPVIW